MRTNHHSPHSPYALAHSHRASGSTQSPSPFIYKRLAGECVCVAKADKRTNEKPGECMAVIARLLATVPGLKTAAEMVEEKEEDGLLLART